MSVMDCGAKLKAQTHEYVLENTRLNGAVHWKGSSKGGYCDI